MAYALENLGLDHATELVVTGSSAGGLSTFLHVDRVAEAVRKVEPSIVVKGAPIVGYFLDHADVGTPNNSYTKRMQYIYGMQSLQAAGSLDPECLRDFAQTPWFCFMSPHMQVTQLALFLVCN